MRAPFLRQFGLLAMLCLVTVVLPAQLRADNDSDNTYTIDGARVRVLVKNGNTYVAIKSGTLNLTYPDGRPMALLKGPTTIMLKSLRGALKVTSTGLQMTKKQSTTLKVAVSAGSKKVTFYSDTKPPRSVFLGPNKMAALYTATAQRGADRAKKARYNNVLIQFNQTFKKSIKNFYFNMLSIDRKQLSVGGG